MSRMLPGLTGEFATILADPPWRFLNRTGKMAPEHRRLRRYETMATPDICRLSRSQITQLPWWPTIIALLTKSPIPIGATHDRSGPHTSRAYAAADGRSDPSRSAFAPANRNCSSTS